MNWIFEALVSLLILIGAFFMVVGSIGLVRLPDVFMRLHAPTKASTLGVGGILVASMLIFTAGDGASVHELLILIFLFITAPVSAHLMGKAGIYLRVPSRTPEPASTEAAEPEPQLSLDSTHVLTRGEAERSWLPPR